MTQKLTLLIVAGALGAAVAGCGSSRAPGIAQAPGNGATADSTTPTVASSSSTATTPAVKTPTSGPLSKEPTIAAGKGAPPKTLQTKNLVTGTGDTAKAGDTVTVNYVGALYKNGKVFDASWKRNQPFTAPLVSPGLIEGWIKGVPGMKVGGRRQLIIPASEAYKNQAQAGIPANSTLIFDIDLLKVTPKQ